LILVDLLIQVFLFQGILGAQAPGASSPTINAGTVRNEGLEFAINYKRFSDDFNISLGYNVTFLRNNVVK
jgi:hypothetical protein